jgi:dienelactone hydrolase
MMRTEVEFAAGDGIMLRAWLFLPDGRGPFPGIAMAHGYTCTRHHGIERFARAFGEAGFAVLLHDHRGFGDSEGAPRQDINPWQQIEDWRRAISFGRHKKMLFRRLQPQGDASVWAIPEPVQHSDTAGVIHVATETCLRFCTSYIELSFVNGVEH